MSEIESKCKAERNLHENCECKNHLRRYFKGKLSMSQNGKCENMKLMGLKKAQYELPPIQNYIENCKMYAINVKIISDCNDQKTCLKMCQIEKIRHGNV